MTYAWAGDEVIDLLVRIGGWLTPKEIAEHLSMEDTRGRAAIRARLMKLYRAGNILWRKGAYAALPPKAETT